MGLTQSSDFFPDVGPEGAGEAVRVDSVETPAALVDLARVRRNLDRVQSYLAAQGLQWRPHIKTHKSLTLARMQVGAGCTGLTVATPLEAEVVAQATSDLLVAHPPLPPKATRLMGLPDSVRLRVALDSRTALDALAAAASTAERPVEVLVEVDAGMGRVGVQSPADAVRLARDVASRPWLSYRGILFYPGHIRVPGPEQDGLLERTAERVGQTLRALSDAGLPAQVVSGGSTPTLWQSHRIPGVTEIRAGTCVFHDRDMWTLGVCDLEEVAYSVLATVVSDAVPGQVVIDAGSKALAKEELRGGGAGYGIVLDRPEVVVRSLSEEHGILDLSGTSWRPQVGDRVCIVPNHVCVSVNLQDRLWAVEPDGTLLPLPLEARGRLPRPPI